MTPWRAPTISLYKATAVFVIIWTALTGYSWQQAHQCATGWFGEKCEYRCRCANDSCMSSGECHPRFFCQIGWFGPACQYVDLAYNRTHPVELTDGNDSTCIHDPTKTKLNITFTRAYFFTWLRLVFKSGITRSVEVYFKDASTTESCDNSAHHTVSHSLDIHCYVNKPFMLVMLDGNLEDLCSVYVSGGRQVALMQRATQSSTYSEMSNNTGFQNVSYLAVKAVDGDSNREFYKGDTCSMSLPRPDVGVFWKLRFSERKSVDRCVLYFPHGSSIHGNGFTLQVQESEGAHGFEQSFTGFMMRPIFTVVLRVVNISVITIRTKAASLELCEVEVYGDSVCPSGRYGRDCEHTCSCPDGSECFPSTGECYQGCLEGFSGETCNPCRVGRYGPGCASLCSVGCARSTDSPGAHCDSINGSCIHGCIESYTGADCSTKVAHACEHGKYGPLCNLQCSPTCEKVINDPLTYCDPTDGTCIYGCQSGSTGSNCNTTCPGDSYGLNCSLSCSSTCRLWRNKICEPVNGLCLHGCLLGYEGAHCTDICRTGYYGAGCTKQCPVTCSVSEKADNSSCDYMNGTCLYGCIEGYVGAHCDEGIANPSTAADKAPNPLRRFYILALFSPMACIYSILICKKVRERKETEEEQENDISQSIVSLSSD